MCCCSFETVVSKLLLWRGTYVSTSSIYVYVRSIFFTSWRLCVCWPISRPLYLCSPRTRVFMRHNFLVDRNQPHGLLHDHYSSTYFSDVVSHTAVVLVVYYSSFEVEYVQAFCLTLARLRRSSFSSRETQRQSTDVEGFFTRHPPRGLTIIRLLVQPCISSCVSLPRIIRRV